jgi:cell division protein DivIC
VTGVQTCALPIFLVVAGVSIYAQQKNIFQLQTEQQTLNAQYEQAQVELQRLQDQKDYMKTKDYVEDTARERFGYAYENEIILDEDDNTN